MHVIQRTVEKDANADRYLVRRSTRVIVMLRVRFSFNASRML